ncbi:hypothetical protein SAMN02745132_00659 [Enterovibrio nigricans DSM 22720]|uniref:Uncharacterized protein n=1 Tax=Enterovibrio nigricans DSM 22720 TaxID=1121868 RepID=A0A1T4U329_9GAMM|nr:hypothetical protein SAMN02745132_00659 [Enterovibrio nigricans DSM 22720]
MRFHSFKEKPDIIRLQGTELCRSRIHSNVLRESTLTMKGSSASSYWNQGAVFTANFRYPNPFGYQRK